MAPTFAVGPNSTLGGSRSARGPPGWTALFPTQADGCIGLVAVARSPLGMESRALPLLRFGETAMFKWSAPSSKIGKAELRFQKGLFVGKHYATNEFLMMTHAGVFPSRTVKRLPLESQVDGALVLAARGL
eukprot:577692-Amphidinium_carterae.1